MQFSINCQISGYVNRSWFCGSALASFTGLPLVLVRYIVGLKWKEGSRPGNGAVCQGPSGCHIPWQAGDFEGDVQAAQNFCEDDILAVQPEVVRKVDEEHVSVGVWSCKQTKITDDEHSTMMNLLNYWQYIISCSQSQIMQFYLRLSCDWFPTLVGYHANWNICGIFCDNCWPNVDPISNRITEAWIEMIIVNSHFNLDF